MSTITLAPVNRRHVPGIDTICRTSSFSLEHRWTDHRISKFVRDPRCRGIVAVTGVKQVVVGYALWERDGDRASLENFAVADGYRRQGVGRSLVQAVEVELSKSGPRWAQCVVHERNLPAQLLLHGLEWRVPAKGGIRREAFGCEDGYVFRYGR